MKSFLFGNTKIGINDDSYKFASTKQTELFEIDDKNVDLMFDFVYSDMEFIKEFVLVEYTGGYEIYNSNQGYFIVFHWCSLTYAFGYYISDIINKEHIQVYMNSKIGTQRQILYSDIIGDLSLHIKFLRNSVAILHCSYICDQNQAILFLGKSGTGKSTQADLWVKYGGATIINGDRALVGKIDGKWYVFGYPACGSSNICKNVTLPIKAFVILEKGDYNSVEQISVSKKVMALVAGMQIYPWMKEEMDLLFAFCLQAVQENKIFKLNCTISEEAVKVVQKELGE